MERCTLRHLRAYLCIGVFLGFFGSSVANAQAAPPQPAPVLQLWNGLSVKAGLSYGFDAHDKHGYYSVTYRGNPIASNGKETVAADASGKFAIDKADKTSSTAPGFQMDVFSSPGKLTGDLFDLLNVHEFGFKPVQLGPDWRGQSELAGDLDFHQLSGAIGIEHMPLHLQDIGLIPTDKPNSLANWLLPGLMVSGQKGGSETAIVTYRAFLGKSEGWKPSRSKQVPFEVDALLGKYPTFDDLSAAVRGLPASNSHTMQENFMIFEAHSGQWNKVPAPAYAETIRKDYKAYTDPYLKEPSWAYWLEGKGWWTVSGDPQGPAFKPLTAAVLTFWSDSGQHSRSQLQFRYEYGYDRADPKTKLNRGLVTVGLNF